VNYILDFRIANMGYGIMLYQRLLITEALPINNVEQYPERERPPKLE